MTLIRAKWPDGYNTELDITVSEWRQNRDLQVLPKCTTALWSGTDPHEAEAYLRIAPKKDRTPLICFYRKLGEEESMICSLRERWLTCEDPHAKAVAIITEVAEQYVRKEVLIGGLHQARDVILKREGVVLAAATGAPAAAKSVAKKEKVQNRQ